MAVADSIGDAAKAAAYPSQISEAMGKSTILSSASKVGDAAVGEAIGEKGEEYSVGEAVSDSSRISALCVPAFGEPIGEDCGKYAVGEAVGDECT